MSDVSHEGVHRHPAPTGFIRKYIFSVDHKVIGIQYIMLALTAVVVGMTMSLLMRLNLSWPGTHWPILETLFPTGAPGGIMTPEFYLSLVTMHGTIMVFFVLTTAPQGGFGNYFLPIQIGAEDVVVLGDARRVHRHPVGHLRRRQSAPWRNVLCTWTIFRWRQWHGRAD